MVTADLYNYKTKIIDIAKYFGASEDEAKDIMQDTFLKLLQIEKKEGNLDRLEYNGKINMVYLFNMVRNLTISMHRKSINKTELTEETAGIDMTLEREQNREQIKAIIKTLPPFYRLLYDAYYGDDISLRRLAKDTGISLTTIHYSIKYIRQYVKSKFVA